MGYVVSIQVSLEWEILQEMKGEDKGRGWTSFTRPKSTAVVEEEFLPKLAVRYFEEAERAGGAHIKAAQQPQQQKRRQEEQAAQMMPQDRGRSATASSAHGCLGHHPTIGGQREHAAVRKQLTALADACRHSSVLRFV